MKILFTAVAGFISAAVIGFAAAQMPPPRDMAHPPVDVAAVLNIDAGKASQVEAILRATHEKMRAAMEENERQLAALLTPEQVAALREAMRRQRPPPR